MRKWIISAASMMAGAAAGAGALKRVEDKKYKRQKELSERHLDLFLLMNQWVKVKQRGKSPADYLEEKNYMKVAVYGMSYVGETLIEELKNTSVQVAYGIDRKGGDLSCEIEVFTMEDPLSQVDAVIVTAITFYDEIEEELSQKVNCPILSLEDILYEI